MMKINIFFEEIQEVAIYFRYYDENNYYVIKMNVPKQKKIEIYKKVAGFESLIGIFLKKTPTTSPSSR